MAAKRVTVSVPDELAEAIEKHKNDFSISPSAVFQSAMKKMIEKEVSFQQRIAQGENMEQIVERLRREKAELENNLHEQGKESGAKWAKAASYEQLLYAQEWEIPRDGGSTLKPFYDETIGEDIRDEFGEHPILKIDLQVDDAYLSEQGEQWLEGWIEGVGAVWRQIEDKL